MKSKKVVEGYDVSEWCRKRLGTEKTKETNEISGWLFEDGVINYNSHITKWFPSEGLELPIRDVFNDTEINSILEEYDCQWILEREGDDELQCFFTENDELIKRVFSKVKSFNQVDRFSIRNKGELLLNMFMFDKGFTNGDVLITG